MAAAKYKDFKHSSYNGHISVFVKYDDLPDDLIEVEKYNNHLFDDLYYSVETNKFYKDIGDKCRELYINGDINKNPYVFAADNSIYHKPIRILYNKFKKMYNITC